MLGVGLLILSILLGCHAVSPHLAGVPTKQTIPVHIPVQNVNSSDTFEVPYWLGAFYADVAVDSDWFLPLTSDNGGAAYPGSFLFIRNYGPGDIILRSTYPETIEGQNSYTLISGTVIEIIPGNDWVIATPFSAGNVTCGAGISCVGTQISLAPVGSAGTTAYPTSITTNEYGQITAKVAGSRPVTSVTGSSGSITSTCLNGVCNIDLADPIAELNAVDIRTDGLYQPWNAKYYGAVGDCAADDTAAIQSAINFVIQRGQRGTVYIPTGCYLVTAPVATRVAVDEGAVFQLFANATGMVFAGDGITNTIIRPKSNKLQIFSQSGAANITFQGMRFDNSLNGLLQGTAKPGTKLGPNTGVLGTGNQANAAIYQWYGDSLTVKDC